MRAIQIISLSFVAFSWRLIVFYRLSEKRSNQGTKCPWPEGKAVDISCESVAPSHDCLYFSWVGGVWGAVAASLLSPAFIHSCWRKMSKDFDYLTVLYLRHNYSFLHEPHGAGQQKIHRQKQLLHRYCSYVEKKQNSMQSCEILSTPHDSGGCRATFGCSKLK